MNENNDKQLLIISMVEDVKEREGSHYLLDKIKEMIENGTIKDAKTIILISKYLMKNAG